MDKFIKENWFKLVIAFAIILIGFSFFYYYVIREGARETARKYCNQWAGDKAGNYGSYPNFTSQAYKNYFESCLREQGVSN